MYLYYNQVNAPYFPAPIGCIIFCAITFIDFSRNA